MAISTPAQKPRGAASRTRSTPGVSVVVDSAGDWSLTAASLRRAAVPTAPVATAVVLPVSVDQGLWR